MASSSGRLSVAEPVARSPDSRSCPLGPAPADRRAVRLASHRERSREPAVPEGHAAGPAERKTKFGTDSWSRRTRCVTVSASLGMDGAGPRSSRDRVPRARRSRAVSTSSRADATAGCCCSAPRQTPAPAPRRPGRTASRSEHDLGAAAPRAATAPASRCGSRSCACRPAAPCVLEFAPARRDARSRPSRPELARRLRPPMAVVLADRRRHDRRPHLRGRRARPAAAPRRTASSRSTSRNPAGSSTTPTTSGPRHADDARRGRGRDRGARARRSPRSASPTSARRSSCGTARTGRPRHRAIVWQDRRTAARCDELRAAGHEPLIRARDRSRARPVLLGDQARVAPAPRAASPPTPTSRSAPSTRGSSGT